MAPDDLAAWWVREASRMLARRAGWRSADIGCRTPTTAARDAGRGSGWMWNAWPLCLWPFAGELRYRRAAGGGLASSDGATPLWAAAGTWKQRRPRVVRLAKIEWHASALVLVRNDRGRKAILRLPAGDLAARVQGACLRGDAARERRLAALLELTLLEIRDRCGAGEREDGGGLLDQACERVREDLAADCDRASVARAIGCHPGHLSRLFSRQLGIGFNAWVRRERVRAAAALLAQSRLDLTAVAARCGLGNASYLIRCFRGEFGATPERWRRARVVDGIDP